jgi:hypothetical protein
MLRAFAIWFVLTMLSVVPCLGGQAVQQDPNSPLFPPSLVSTGDDALAGLSLAPVPSIPFSGTVEIENQTMATDGNIVIHRLRSKVARDGKGRTRIDVDLNILSEPVNPQLVTIHIFDAVKQADITLFPSVQYAMHWNLNAAPRTRFKPELFLRQIPAGKMPVKGQIEIHHEELGMKLIDGMKLRHGREITYIPAGQFENKSPYTITLDYWFSQELQAFVMVKRHGPRNSTQTMTLREIQRQQPAASLFRIPNGYKVEEIESSEPDVPKLL